MQLTNADYIIDSIKDMDKEFCFDNLSCWKKQELNYNIYIFVIQCKNEQELSKVYSNLRDYIAFYFQGQILTKDVERWNIYQVHLVESQVSKSLELMIEQDKYSTRKIVKSNLGQWHNSNEINTRLYKELFEFDVKKSNVPEIPLESRLDDEDLDTLRLVVQFSEGETKQNLDLMIEELNK
ncbi:ABC-three component system middle component 1 [Vibrio campbellii]|uniref:ABC-three component system middle component 1 n=1 Tax=Vibrio campbellii TaxID=680 RepID=UPI003F866F71